MNTGSLKSFLYLGTALTAFAASPVAAQAVQDTIETEAAASAGEIVVTGTRIARDGFQAPTPLVVLSQAEIENSSPSNNIADFVNQMPALAGSTRPANSRLNLSSGQAGINSLNLRNLGGVRTLVLVDGRRSVGSTITGLVDVNTIPQLLIKNVEIVTGGASAAYGSDAVAGVVNFVLDKKFEGLKLTADAGVSTYGDGASQSIGGAFGKSFAGGRGHFVVSAEYARADGVFEVDRDWNYRGDNTIINPAYHAVNNNSVPQYIVVRGRSASASSTPGGLITRVFNGSQELMNNPLRGTYFGANGATGQFDFGDLYTGGNYPSSIVGGDWQMNDTNRRQGMSPNDNRYGFFGRLSYELSDSVSVFAEASYNRQRVTLNAGPNLMATHRIKADNAFLMQLFTPAQLAGITEINVASSHVDLPNRHADNERKVQRYVVGAEGSFEAFGRAARWDVYAQYGRAEMHERLRNIMNIQRYNNASDAVFAADGSIQCRINVDPSLTSDANCRPLNRMGIGVNTDPSAFNYFLGDPYRDEIAEQFVTGANLSATPFATWAGDVSVAVGAEYREEKIRGHVPTEYQPMILTAANGAMSTSNSWSVGNYLPTNGSYNVKEAYLETVVPLGLGIEFNGAVRATEYSTAGYVTTWKAGVTWKPIDDIRFRVTRSRDIRAPNLNELYQAGSSNSDSVNNPFFIENNNQALNGVLYNQRIPYSATVTGNTSLTPEKANSWNLGAVFTPTFLPGFSASVDYFRISMNDTIDTISAQEIINRCFDGRANYCEAIRQDENNADRILFRNQPFNFASKLARGVDLDASYRLPLSRIGLNSLGMVTLRGVGTRYIENITDTGIPSTRVVNTVGVNSSQGGTPTWIYRFSVGYDDPGFAGTVTARGVSAGVYSSSAIVCETNCPISTPQSPTYAENRVSGLFYVDLNLTKKIKINDGSSASMFLNVTNLFNRDPMLLPETGISANTTYSDLLGRMFRVGVRINLR